MIKGGQGRDPDSLKWDVLIPAIGGALYLLAVGILHLVNWIRS